MISTTDIQTKYGDLSQNTATNNLSRGLYLANQEQRYLLEKFFSNEASFTMTTVGSQTLTITATVAITGTSATLTSAWIYPTCQTTITFSDGEQRLATFTFNSTAVTWANGLTGTQFTLTTALTAGATTGVLNTAWAYSTQSTATLFADGETKTVTYTAGSTAISWSGGLSSATGTTINTSIITTSVGVGGLQTYRLPSDYSKLKTGTLTIGSLKWTPVEIMTRGDWDRLNVFPYYADIPSNFFIWNNQFNLWPIPSSTGNIISFNYKRRIPDLSLADYSTGTVSVSNGGVTVTGVGTSWIPTTNIVSESRYIQFSENSGDNLWYQVQSVDSATSLTLYAPYQGITIAGGTYTLGQMPLLMEDFHDMLYLKPLIVYFTAIAKDPNKAKMFQEMYDQKLKLLEEYAGSKTINVNLSRHPMNHNPNLYPQNIG